MRVIQVLPTISWGDAVGNIAIALKRGLQEQGYQTEIYAKNIDERLPAKTAYPVSDMGMLQQEDVMIYHLSTGDELNDEMTGQPCRKVLHYHNITPPEYFSGYHIRYELRAAEGLRAAANWANYADLVLADSEFNRQDLLRMGYRQPIYVLPVLIPYQDYEREPDPVYMERLSDGKNNLLFVGRIAPNKCQQDVIRAFFYYHETFDRNSRLILAGADRDMERYRQELQLYGKKLGIEQDVIFTGHIRFEELLACYHAADVFVCMSDHEGFGVPLVEAMYFGLPVVAYAAAAVPETLGQGGLLLQQRDAKLAAEAIHALMTRDDLKDYLKEKQQERLKQLSYQNVLEQFLHRIQDFCMNQ